MSNDRYMLRKQRVKLGLSPLEAAQRAGMNIRQYYRFENGERELSETGFQTVQRILTALQLSIEKYAAGEYEIKEMIYRGHDSRLYNYETDEPIESCLEKAEATDNVKAGEEKGVIMDIH